MPTGRPNGRPPKPTEVKRATGNPGKRPLPIAPVPGQGEVAVKDAGIPDPPYPLNSVGLHWWYQTWQAGSEWLSPTADLQIVYDIAKNREETDAIQQEFDQGRATRFYNNNGRLYPHPLVAQLRSLEALRTGWLASLGFSPADRARLGLTEVRTMDAYDSYKERVRARETDPVAADLLDETPVEPD